MLAVAAAVGASWPHRVPLILAVLVGLSGVLLRRAVPLALAAAMAASGGAAAAWDGLRRAPTTGTVAGVATLVTDPVDVRGAVRAEVRLHGRRLEAWARGRPAGVLRVSLAGERVRVRGERAPVRGRRARYLAVRHVGAHLNVWTAAPEDGGALVARVSNAARRRLLDGAASLSPERRALFAGIVLGDDRHQSETLRDDFRRAGLAHLTAVSGQNVAFVLAVAMPLLSFLGRRLRLLASLAVLGAFGVLTRWEPSVIRAVAMAAVVLTGVALGRPVSTVRALALAVTGVLLLDPLLVGSLGFRLSVAACTGIALLTGPLSRRKLPLPVAVTVAAQAGVAPILVPAFGGIPLVSVPANLLAVPAAGPLMMWGMAAGGPAGVLGGSVATWLHVPTDVALAWLEKVAHTAANANLGALDGRGLVALALCAASAVAVPRLRFPAALVAAVVCVVAVAVPCRFGPCASPSAIAPTTWPPGRSSWASSTAPPTPSTTRVPISPWTPSSPGPSSSWPRAPTSSTWAG